MRPCGSPLVPPDLSTDHWFMNAEFIERIESKIAYLERANAELSDVVYRQHQEIEALRERFKSLQGRVEALPAQEPARTPEDERPPHY